jgi:hypothetical protein
MRTSSIRNKDKKVTIYLNELRQLVFWASVALNRTKIKGGQYYSEVGGTIQEFRDKYKCPTD